ncbi:hypothetical protein Q8F99_26670, partial [Klebsiella pneumoniae]|nr:hypothetical protein [Klebsiella pneumoniae]
FKQPVVLPGALPLSFSNLPIITSVALPPVILIDDGGLWRCAHARTQGPVLRGVVIGGSIEARFIKQPDLALIHIGRCRRAPSRCCVVWGRHLKVYYRQMTLV